MHPTNSLSHRVTWLGLEFNLLLNSLLEVEALVGLVELQNFLRRCSCLGARQLILEGAVVHPIRRFQQVMKSLTVAQTAACLRYFKVFAFDDGLALVLLLQPGCGFRRLFHIFSSIEVW
jgi:hypothetical protein